MSGITIPVRPRTLRLRLCLVGFGALLAAGVTAIPAKADTSGLVDWAYSNGFTGTPNTITTRGALVCVDLAAGDNGEQAAIDLWLNTGIVALSDAERFVVAAVEQLCPQFDHRHDAPAPDFGAYES